MGRTNLGSIAITKELNDKGLNDRQRHFVVEYCKDYNSTRAAESAGYSNPAVMGRKLISGKYYPKVTNAIASIQRRNIEVAILTKEQILGELSNLAMRDIIDLCDEEGVFRTDDLRKIPPDIRRCIDGMKIKQKHDENGNIIGQEIELKLVAKLGAIDMLAKHFGLFAPEKHEVTHSLDWDALFDELPPSDYDVIEAKIDKVK